MFSITSNGCNITNYQFEELKRRQGKKFITTIGLINTTLLLFLSMNIISLNYKLDNIIKRNINNEKKYK